MWAILYLAVIPAQILQLAEYLGSRYSMNKAPVGCYHTALSLITFLFNMALLLTEKMLDPEVHDLFIIHL